MPNQDIQRTDYREREAAVKRGLDLHRAGATWKYACEAVGLGYETLRSAADPEFAQRRRDGINARRRADYSRRYIPPDTHRVERVLTPKEALAALASIPHDTRSFTARAFGDPLPGRSALDRRNRVPVNAYAQEAASDSPTIHTSHTSSWRAG